MLAPSKMSVRGVLEKMAGLAASVVAARAGLHKVAIPARERSALRWLINRLCTSEMNRGQWHERGRPSSFGLGPTIRAQDSGCGRLFRVLSWSEENEERSNHNQYAGAD